MGNDNSTALGRELGTELRRLREAAGLNGREMSHRLGCSQSKVSRMETGARGSGSETELAMYLAHCRVRKRTVDQMLDHFRQLDGGYWLQQHRQQLPGELRSLIFQEATATAIHNYEPLLIPGLLQTESYVCALFREGNRVPAEQIDALVQARLDRQEILRRRWPPPIQFLVHEQALRLPVGGVRIMHEQMLHMLFVCNRPHCTIRVVPSAAGARAFVAGSFELTEQGEFKPIVYVESEVASLFLENTDDIAAYRANLARLNEIALDEGQSREFLATMASEYDRPEEDPDAHEERGRTVLAHE